MTAKKACARFESTYRADFSDVAVIQVGDKFVHQRRCRACDFQFAAHAPETIAIVEELHRFLGHEIAGQRAGAMWKGEFIA